MNSNFVNEYTHSLDLNPTNFRNKHLSNKIGDFYVLTVSNHAKKFESESPFILQNTVRTKESLMSLPIFSEAVSGSNTFMVWEQTYQENKAMFLRMRQNARNDLITRIARNIVAYLLSKYVDQLGLPINPLLKDTDSIERAIVRVSNLLRKETFLVNNSVWENFCQLMNLFLKDWVLMDIEKSVGQKQMETMNELEINELFSQFFMKSFSENQTFLANYFEYINGYFKAWLKDIMLSMNLENFSIKEVADFLNIKEAFLPEKSILPPAKDITFTLLEKGYLLVMSNAPYQSVRESLIKKSFEKQTGTPWPTAPLNKGNVKGTVQLKPNQLKNGYLKESHSTVQEAWVQVKELSELVVDVFDALCSIFLS
ncbi:hypothetical protein, partial [Neobacillus vireti]|uniref:hypothetical protein n=1 Tax=Neobacillus vireti TaxID=220686 RepID=UPI002FFD6EE0